MWLTSASQYGFTAHWKQAFQKNDNLGPLFHPTCLFPMLFYREKPQTLNSPPVFWWPSLWKALPHAFFWRCRSVGRCTVACNMKLVTPPPKAPETKPKEKNSPLEKAVECLGGARFTRSCPPTSVSSQYLIAYGAWSICSYPQMFTFCKTVSSGEESSEFFSICSRS